MADRAINSTGVAPVVDVSYFDENTVFLTVLAGGFASAHTTLALSHTASGAGDNSIFTDAGSYAGATITKDINVYVVSSERWTFSKTANGVTTTTTMTVSSTVAVFCGVYLSAVITGAAGASIHRCMAHVGSGTVLSGGADYYNCIGLSDSTNMQRQFHGSNCHNCLIWHFDNTIHPSSTGFHSCNVENCIAMGWPTGQNFFFSSAIGDGFNMSSDSSAVGTTTWTGIGAASIFTDVSAATPDAHWIDKDTAELYIGADVVDGDADNVVRSLNSTGPFDFAGGGGGGGGGGAVATANASNSLGISIGNGIGI